jgi:hypothetical protein
MSSRTKLALLSIVFAVLWTAGMLWLSAPLEVAQAVIFVISGGIAGVLWYLLFGMWYRWHFGLDRNYRSTRNP